jgi:hypothetical protein
MLRRVQMAPRFTEAIELLDVDAGTLRASKFLHLAVSTSGLIGEAVNGSGLGLGLGLGTGAGAGLGLEAIRAPSPVVWGMIATACALLLGHEVAVRTLARKFLDEYGRN